MVLMPQIMATERGHYCLCGCEVPQLCMSLLITWLCKTAVVYVKEVVLEVLEREGLPWWFGDKRLSVKEWWKRCECRSEEKVRNSEEQYE